MAEKKEEIEEIKEIPREYHTSMTVKQAKALKLDPLTYFKIFASKSIPKEAHFEWDMMVQVSNMFLKQGAPLTENSLIGDVIDGFMQVFPIFLKTSPTSSKK